MSQGSETLAFGFNTIISEKFMGAQRTATLFLSPENLGLFRTKSGYLVQCWQQNFLMEMQCLEAYPKAQDYLTIGISNIDLSYFTSLLK